MAAVNVSDVVQLTLKTPLAFQTNTGGTPTDGGTTVTSLQTIKEFKGTVQAVDATTGAISVRGTVRVGAADQTIDVIVQPQNLIGMVRFI